MNFSLDLKSWIEVFTAIGTLAAAIFAGFALRQSNKQLKIEQSPYLVLDHIKPYGRNQVGFYIKNIGRGPAMHITFSLIEQSSNRNDAFFSNDQPHSANLSSQTESGWWLVDTHTLTRLAFNDSYAYLFAYFESQAGNLYRTNVKIKKITKSGGIIEYIVMENKVIELKESSTR